jgi:hypothetical protein
MTVSSGRMFVGDLAMVESCNRVFLRLGVLSEIVEMGRLMMLMCGGVVMRGSLVVMVTRRMLMCHFMMFLPGVKSSGRIVNGQLSR